MKVPALCLFLLMLTGCAAKKHVAVPVPTGPAIEKPSATIPAGCILGGLANKAKCEVLDAEAVVCYGVVVKIACWKAKHD